MHAHEIKSFGLTRITANSINLEFGLFKVQDPPNFLGRAVLIVGENIVQKRGDLNCFEKDACKVLESRFELYKNAVEEVKEETKMLRNSY